MKKTILILTMALMLSFAFTSCSTIDSMKDDLEENYDGTDDGNDVASDDEDNDAKDNEDSSVLETSSNGLFSGNAVILADESLTGIALLESATFSDKIMYNNFISETKTAYYDDNGNAYEGHNNMIMYGENYKMETESDNMKTIIIYLGEEGATYNYAEDGSFAYLTYDSEFSEDDFEDSEIEVISADGNMTLSEFVMDGYNLNEAMVTELNGESVVYIEMESTESYGSSINKMWLSIELGVAIKSEYYYNDQLYSSSEIISFEYVDQIPDSTFEVPDNIEFQDFSESYFDMDDVDLGDIDLGDIDIEGLDLGDLEGIDLNDIDLGDINLEDIDLGDIDLGDINMGN
jgi:outer membrane lipoprotein-sorting protein